jgi:hypothetical protein
MTPQYQKTQHGQMLLLLCFVRSSCINGVTSLTFRSSSLDDDQDNDDDDGTGLYHPDNTGGHISHRVIPSM